MSAASSEVRSNGLAPLAEQLFEIDANGPHLIGGLRKSDGRMVFPFPKGSEAALYEPVALANKGTLWSFTVQRFRPKSPPYAGNDDEKTFKPFALGYVELSGQVIVETRLTIDDFSKLRIGMPMTLELSPFDRADGTRVTSYQFRPA